MAVSKRLRYEILRRDNHACRYCGATAPDVKLAVDHVIPVALGGSDEPSNLITACEPCNSGKSATVADSPVVADVDHRATQWASAIRQAADMISADSMLINDICDRVDDIMPTYRPRGWRNSIQQILAAGLPEETIVDMAHVAVDAYGVKDRWKYFFGCCWSRVRELQSMAAKLLDASDDAQEHARSIATSICSEQCSGHHPRQNSIDWLRAEVDAELHARYGLNLPECLCFGDCEADDPALCRIGIAYYMQGWMGHENVHGSGANSPEKPSEVTDGTALDPA